MSGAYVLSAVAVGACWTVPLLVLHRRYRKPRRSNVVTFPCREAKVYELPRRGAS